MSEYRVDRPTDTNRRSAVRIRTSIKNCSMLCSTRKNGGASARGYCLCEFDLFVRLRHTLAVTVKSDGSRDTCVRFPHYVKCGTNFRRIGGVGAIDRGCGQHECIV